MDMKRHYCELCGEELAHHICSKCHRLICENCYNYQLDLCIDCVEIKLSTSKNYMLLLDRYDKLCREIINKSNNSLCINCRIYRDMLLTTLYDLKRLKSMFDVEGLLDEKSRAEEIYQILEKEALRYITKLLTKLKSIR